MGMIVMRTVPFRCDFVTTGRALHVIGQKTLTGCRQTVCHVSSQVEEALKGGNKMQKLYVLRSPNFYVCVRRASVANAFKLWFLAYPLALPHLGGCDLKLNPTKRIAT